MSNLTKTPQSGAKPERPQAPSLVEVPAEEEEAVAAWPEQEREDELRSRYCDDPFCTCTPGKMRFLNLVGILDDDDGLTRYGETLKYLWNTDPGADREEGSR